MVRLMRGNSGHAARHLRGPPLKRNLLFHLSASELRCKKNGAMLWNVVGAWMSEATLCFSVSRPSSER